jgi:integrase
VPNTKPAQKLNFGSEMGQKKSKGTVSIINAEGRIRLRWRYHTKRFSINLGEYNKINIVEAKKVALTIESDIIYNVLDITLLKYKKKLKVDALGNSLISMFEYWVINFRNKDCDVHCDYFQVKRMLMRWKNVNESSILGLLNSEALGPKTYSQRLSILKKFTEWLYKNKHWNSKPLEDVASRKRIRTKRLDRKPFTFEEIQLILEAIKTDRFNHEMSHYKHSFYYPFLYFLFKTGCRPSEAVGLRVGSIDMEKNIILVKEILVSPIKTHKASLKVRKATKNGYERVLPLTDDLKYFIKPLMDGKESDDLIFKSNKNLAINLRDFQRHTFKPVLKKLGIENRVLYACRHTFASRCIDEGMSPITTAFLMGNSPEVALNTYTHQISLPNKLPKILD